MGYGASGGETVMSIRLKWRVGEVPTGRYRSFEHRAWPSAEWPDQQGAAYLTCEDDYTPERAAGRAAHAPIRVWVRIYRADGTGQFDNRALKSRPASLDSAKALVHHFFEAQPSTRPAAYRTEVLRK